MKMEAQKGFLGGSEGLQKNAHRNVKSLIGILSACLLIWFMGTVEWCDAQDININPAFKIRGEYDDNALFERTDKIEDSLGIITPSIDVNYHTELLKLQMAAIVDVLRYVDESDLDTEKEYYKIGADYRVQPRLTLGGNISLIRDTTLDSFLEETGRAFRRDDRDQYKADGQFSYQLSEISNIIGQYRFTKADFSGVLNSDYDRHDGVFSYNRRLKNNIDTLTLQTNYYHRDSDVSMVDNFGVSVGWTRLWTATLKSSALIGPRYTRGEDKKGNSTDDIGITADINITQKRELSSSTVGYSQNLGTTGDGREIQIYNFYLRHSQGITERLGIGFAGRIVFSRAVREDIQDIGDSRYFVLQPYLYYRLTENHTLNLAYSYQNSYDDELVTNQTAERNRVWLEITFRFPMKF